MNDTLSMTILAFQQCIRRALPSTARADLRDVDRLYAALCDTRSGVLTFSTAMAKLALLHTGIACAQDGGTRIYELVLSGVASRVGEHDFASAHFFQAALATAEELLAVAPSAADTAAGARRGHMHPNLARLSAVLKQDVAEFQRRQPTKRYIDLPQAQALFTPGSAFMEFFNCGAFAELEAQYVTEAGARAKALRDRERQSFMEQMARVRMPKSALKPDTGAASLDASVT